MFEGARSGTPERAIEDGIALAKAGFEMLDVGAIAARSGPAVPAGEEAERLIPAIRGLVEQSGVPVTADTYSPEVARDALDAGAVAINDIGGGGGGRGEVARDALDAGAVAINDIGGGSDEMFELAAETGCGLVLMHIEGPPREKRATPHYDDPVQHIKTWFAKRIEAADAHGVSADQIAIDPGLDFDLSAVDDLEIIRRLGELRELGRSLYVSLSRKDFLGAVLAGSWEDRLPAGEREWATAAAATLAVVAGADLLRLHDPSALQAMRVAAAIDAPRGAALV